MIVGVTTEAGEGVWLASWCCGVSNYPRKLTTYLCENQHPNIHYIRGKGRVCSKLASQNETRQRRVREQATHVTADGALGDIEGGVLDTN